MVWSVTPLPHWLHLRSNQQQFWPLNWRRTCLHEEVPNGLLVRSSKSNFGLWDLKSPTFCFDFSPVGVWGAYFASDRKVRQLRESYLEYFKIEPSTDFDSTSSRFGMRPWQSKSHWSTSLKAISILCTSNCILIMLTKWISARNTETITTPIESADRSPLKEKQDTLSYWGLL